MKNLNKCLVCLFAVAAFAVCATGQNLKAEEIIAKHLNSIGSDEKRAAMKTVMAIGASEFESNVPVVKGGGRAIVVSDPNNLFFVISLNSREYPFEKIGYFDGKTSLPFSTAGARSLLGAFLSEHEKILSDGLYDGVMSLRWPLYDTDKRKPKLSGVSMKKVGDRKAYALDYNPTGGGSKEFSIKLYFDAENFRHLRSEYRYEVQPTDGTFGQQNRRANAVVILTENFSDFKTVDGLTLPHYHRVDLQNNGNSGVYQNTWGVRVVEYRLNQVLAADFFTFDTK